MSIRSLYNRIVLCLHCCFSASMKVQSVVGCFRSKFLLKSLIESYVGYFCVLISVFHENKLCTVQTNNNRLFSCGQLTFMLHSCYVCLWMAVLK